mmetsp:Transcript_12585/g.18873  ORF Transcript_12585/g.18873 Transcript_12585/m.18873 type:complete len:129 (-) Transcript_12585:82-468(-)
MSSHHSTLAHPNDFSSFVDRHVSLFAELIEFPNEHWAVVACRHSEDCHHIRVDHLVPKVELANDDGHNIYEFIGVVGQDGFFDALSSIPLFSTEEEGIDSFNLSQFYKVYDLMHHKHLSSTCSTFFEP